MKVVIIGLGVHGKGTAELLVKKGAQVVSAADPRHAGEDLGSFLGVDSHKGTAIVASAADIDWSREIDIAVVTAKLGVEDFADLAIDLVGRGVDVITIIEDLYDLKNFAPEQYERVHGAALAAGKTVSVTGGQDINYTGIVLSLSALVQELRGIRLRLHLGIDGYPEEFLRWCGIGVTNDEFAQSAQEAIESPSFFGAVLPAVADALGLRITATEREMLVFTLEEPLYSQTYGREIAAGMPAGRRDIVTVHTEQGIELSAELTTTAVMGQDQFAGELEGVPGIEFVNKIDPSYLSVDASLVNRIPDIIKARPGFLLTPDLPLARYRATLTGEDDR